MSNNSSLKALSLQAVVPRQPIDLCFENLNSLQKRQGTVSIRDTEYEMRNQIYSLKIFIGVY